jgi:phospholipase C
MRIPCICKGIPYCLCLMFLAGCLLGGCRGINSQSIPDGGANNGSTSDLPQTNSAVQRIIVLVLQNASFDHLFGTFPGADGFHPGVPGYTQADANGNSVSPFLLTVPSPKALPEGRKAYLSVWNNGAMDKFAFYNGDEAMGYYDGSTPGVGTLWSYAQQFALADNYFHSVMSEAPTNQLYMVAAQDASAYPVQPFYGPCQPSDSAAKPYTFGNVGDELTEKKIDWTLFAENYGMCGGSYNPEHNPFQYFTSTNNSSHIQDFSQFASQLASGTLPPVSFIIPDHAHDMHPGGGSIANSVAWLDSLIQQVQKSSVWEHAAIVVTWDTGGGWYDHVPPPQVDLQGLGFRVPMLVISPLAKKGYISHTPMDHVSILKFIQWNWGLASLNARNAMGNDIRDMFEGF